MGTLLLFQKDKKHISINILACLLIFSGLTLLNDVLVTSGISNRIKQLYFIPIYYSLSIAPLFYLFVKSKFSYQFNKSDLVHLVIPIIQTGVYFSIGFRSVEFKSILYDENAFRMYLQIESFLFPISLVGYTVLALIYLKGKDYKKYFWSEDIKKWLLRFSTGMLFIALIEFIFSIMEYNTSPTFLSSFPFYLVHTFALSAFVFWISINGFKQYYPLHIFTSKPNQKPLAIDENELAELLKRLELLMTNDKLFLNPDLNLELLSKYLEISEKHCSLILSKGIEMNFNQYVNNFRIAAFKERVKEGQSKTFTLTSIAYECGFNSKSTFNRVFKSTCGVSPSEFVKMTQSTTTSD
ncbi:MULTISPECIES: helix-turn-helix domain-containing protein [unclassified Allomuricauda]|uniref:helix-turn-helix domain-containing protein n=1 Tax=unclassified Allomuricauda TaxID=2615049 RepID=UPI00273E54A2|nr:MULTISPECIES: response regulator transcription factor [unclassified Allomuricauda]